MHSNYTIVRCLFLFFSILLFISLLSDTCFPKHRVYGGFIKGKSERIQTRATTTTNVAKANIKHFSTILLSIEINLL